MEFEIVAFKRSGNGQSVCARCDRLGGSYPVFWDSMLYDVPGLQGCFCGRCVSAMRADPNEGLSFVSHDVKGGASDV